MAISARARELIIAQIAKEIGADPQHVRDLLDALEACEEEERIEREADRWEDDGGS